MSSTRFAITRRGDRLEISGLTHDELEEMSEQVRLVHLLRAEKVVGDAELTTTLRELVELLRTVQAERSATMRDELLRVLMSREVNLNPPASLLQAQRLAAHRDGLLTTPVFTHETLSELRGGGSESSTRTWLARRRDEHAVFTVTYKGKTVIPAFQLDEAGEPRPELRPMLTALHEGGLDGWSVWTWLTKPTAFLSGSVPEDVARTNPERALRAARRFAAAPAA